VKTTIDLPDPIFRKAKATAAERGVSLKTFITEAVESRLSTVELSQQVKPWMALMNELPAVSKDVIDNITLRVAEADAKDMAQQTETHS